MDVFDLFAKISLDTGDYENSLNEASGKTSSFADKLKSGLATAAKVGAAALTAAAGAVVAFGKSAIDAGATFDSSMSQVAATMGTTVDQIQELRDFAMEMGAKTAFSASQAADALNYMALAGYDAEQSMEALPNVLNLAAAGGIELAAASDMITDAQSALGLSMEESAELVDKMAKASSKSNTSVAQLGEAILTIGGTAKNLSGGTTELSAALGILADNGVKGAEGGTALRNIILSLSAPTDTAAKAMKSLGLEVYDASGNMRPLNETFSDLEAVLSTMTQGEQTQVLNQIFNKVDLKSVNALLANTGERFDELTGYINDASGAAEAMAATQLDNLNGDITLFQSALEGAQIVLSDQLTPSLRNFVQFGSEGISKVATAFQEGGLSGAMDVLGDVLSDGINMILEMAPQVVSAGSQLLGSLANGIIGNLPTLVDGAAEIILTLSTGIAESLPELIPTIVDIVLKIVDTLIDNVDNLVDAALAIILALADGLLEVAPKLLDKVPEIVQKLVSAFITNAPKLLAAALELIIALGVGLVEYAVHLPKYILDVLSGIVDGFLDGVEKLEEVGEQLLAGLWQGISNKFQWLKDKVGGVVDGIIERFTGKDGFDEHSPSKVFKTIGEYMMQGLAIGMENSKGEVMETAEDIINEVTNRFSGVYNVLTAHQDVGDLEFQLWERTVGSNATDAEKYEKQLEILTAQQQDQESVVEAAAAAYETIVQQYGDSSLESYEYQKTLLEEMLTYQDLIDKINEVVAAKEKLYNISTGTVDFSDSALAKTSEAAVNAIASNSYTQDVTLNATLVAPDGTKFANYYLPSFIKAGAANGTPIASGQYA